MAVKSDFNDQLDHWAIYRAFSGINDGFTIEAFNDEDMFYWYQAIIAAIPAAGAVHFKGFIDASTNPNYPAAVVGDQYEITVKGKIGGAAGVPVEPGDLLEANVDTPAGDEATVGTNWIITQFGLQQIFEITGSDLSFSVLRDLTETIGRDFSFSVIQDSINNVGRDYSLTVINNYTENIGGNYSMTATGTVFFSGSNFTVQTDGKILAGLAPTVRSLSIGQSNGYATVNNSNTVLVGVSVATNLTTGIDVIAFGVNVLNGLTTGQATTAFGQNIASSGVYTSSANTLFGQSLAIPLSTGFYNALFGSEIMLGATNQTRNSIMGARGGYNYTASYGVIMGFEAAMVGAGDGIVAIGASSLKATTAGAVTALGYESGLRNVTGTGSVFLGYQAGAYETLSNKLFIDNNQRASEADGRVKALIYGIFDAATANQELHINALTINVDDLQVGNAGLVTGDLYADSAVNIAGNGDLIIGRKA